MRPVDDDDKENEAFFEDAEYLEDTEESGQRAKKKISNSKKLFIGLVTVAAGLGVFLIKHKLDSNNKNELFARIASDTVARTEIMNNNFAADSVNVMPDSVKQLYALALNGAKFVVEQDESEGKKSIPDSKSVTGHYTQTIKGKNNKDTTITIADVKRTFIKNFAPETDDENGIEYTTLETSIIDFCDPAKQRFVHVIKGIHYKQAVEGMLTTTDEYTNRRRAEEFLPKPPQ